MQFEYVVKYKVQKWSHLNHGFVWEQKQKFYSQLQDALMAAYMYLGTDARNIEVWHVINNNKLCSMYE